MITTCDHKTCNGTLIISAHDCSTRHCTLVTTAHDHRTRDVTHVTTARYHQQVIIALGKSELKNGKATILQHKALLATHICTQLVDPRGGVEDVPNGSEMMIHIAGHARRQRSRAIMNVCAAFSMNDCNMQPWWCARAQRVRHQPI